MSDQDRIPVILKGGARTAIGRFVGGLASLTATELGAVALGAAVTRSGIDPDEVDEVTMGHVVTAGAGQAPARQAAIRGGLPASIPAVTVNKVCGSGLKAVMLAAQAIRAGDARLVVAGGMESMSDTPHYLHGLRDGVKLGNQSLQDGVVLDGLQCAFGNCHTGGHAEYTAREAGVSCSEADAFALESHRRAVRAIDTGIFADEIVPVEVRDGKASTTVDVDESPRRDTTAEALALLEPAFGSEAPRGIEELVVTAGNAPGLSDGAAAVAVCSLGYALAHGLAVDANVTGYASAATEPRDLFFAPADAVRRLMRGEEKAISDYRLIEVNEAFAVQAIADIRALKMDPEHVNVNGGAIALGHPIGCSGTRVLVTLLAAMQDRGAETGFATLCLGGGNAVALSVERT